MSVVAYEPDGVTVDGLVAAHGTPDTGVHVNDGVAIIAGTVVPFANTDLTVTTADATQDRTDAVVVSTGGTVSIIAGSVNDGVNAAPPDTTGYALLAYITVLNQGSPTYTGTITAGAINTSVKNSILLPTPALTFIWSFLSAAQSADPGAGNFGFDATTLGAITTLYINYQSATSGGVGGLYGSGTINWFKQMMSGSPNLSVYFLIWSRSNPANWILYNATGFTDHSTYGTLPITKIATSTALTTPPLLTAALDTAITIMQMGPAAATTPSGTLNGIRNILHGTTSYTPTAGTNTLYAECVGGGGASGGYVSSLTVDCAPGAGGGGAYAASKITSVNSGAHTVAVGAGGTVGTTGNNPGNAGGDTSFTKAGGEAGTAPLAKGGSGGGGDPGSTSSHQVAGGAGGQRGSCTGDIVADGDDGGAGVCPAVATLQLIIGGSGGGSFFGASLAGTVITSTTVTAASAGYQFGGGANGAVSSKQTGANHQGAAGGDGLLRITEYT